MMWWRRLLTALGLSAKELPPPTPAPTSPPVVARQPSEPEESAPPPAPQDEGWLKMCLPITKACEGCAKKLNGMIVPYLDKLANPPRWTRGYGRTYGITADSPPITQKQADDELTAGLTRYSMQLCKMSPALMTRPPCRAAATDWAWNCGVHAYQVSRLRKAIDDGRWSDAAQYITKPDTAGGRKLRGLQKRRAMDARVFSTGIGG